MPPSKPPQLDVFDRKILEILQRDNTTPQRTIGAAVSLSAPAVQRRIKRMTEDGVIRANVAVVDPAAVGQAITIFVEVEVISETAEQIEQAKREFAAAPEIQQCYYVTGEADFVLVVVVPSMADYEAPAACSSATTMSNASAPSSPWTGSRWGSAYRPNAVLGVLLRGNGLVPVSGAC